MFSRNRVACNLFLKKHKINDSFHVVRNESSLQTIGKFMRISEEVLSAVHHGRPLVALESAIITHGMPYPDNVDTAIEVESLVRRNGAIPATVAVLNGKLCVGLSASEIEQLASGKLSAIKISRRDLTSALSQKLNGGTTVSSTMFAAHQAGIDVFVTGGIGGVHRGVESSMDISCDLVELGRTNVAVVCAGAKSILDIGRTLEFLETQGVPVATVGSNKEFPSFFSQSSGYLSPHNVDSPLQAARMLAVHKLIGSPTGVLLAVPIPAEFALCHTQLEQCIGLALDDAKRFGVTGKDITPFLLRKVQELLPGKSLKANIALIKNNATIGSQIASELSKMNRHETKPITEANRVPSNKISNNKVVVIGGINFDVTSSIGLAEELKVNTKTHPGRIHHSFGGVGRNIADCLSRLGNIPLFISAVGNDVIGKTFHASYNHMDLSGVEITKSYPTASYCCSLTSHGELLYGIGDYDCHQHINPQLIEKFKHEVATAELVCMDGNISSDSMLSICKLCHSNGVPVWFEPTDVRHIGKLFKTDAWKYVSFSSPNETELRHLSAALRQRDTFSVEPCNDLSLEGRLKECIQHARIVLPHIPNLVVTLGVHGVLIARRADPTSHFPTKSHLVSQMDANVTFVHYPAVNTNQQQLISVSGAGDCLAAGMISAIANHESPDVVVKSGLLAAAFSLQSYNAVPESISSHAFTPEQVLQLVTLKPTVLQT